MLEEYVETEMSKRARKRIEQIPPDSFTGQRYKEGVFEYDPRLREELSTKSGELDITRIYDERLKEASYPEDTLTRLCLKLNLTGEEVNEIIKERFRYQYSDWPSQENARMLVKHNYPLWCEEFGIKPDENFPNW